MQVPELGTKDCAAKDCAAIMTLPWTWNGRNKFLLPPIYHLEKKQCYKNVLLEQKSCDSNVILSFHVNFVLI